MSRDVCDQRYIEIRPCRILAFFILRLIFFTKKREMVESFHPPVTGIDTFFVSVNKEVRRGICDLYILSLVAGIAQSV
jgi:hypothetical protein